MYTMEGYIPFSRISCDKFKKAFYSLAFVLQLRLPQMLVAKLPLAFEACVYCCNMQLL